MKAKQLSLPFEPISELNLRQYSLRITPPEPVFSEVNKLKKKFRSVYGKYPLGGSEPHITIAGFISKGYKESGIVDILSHLTVINPFKVEINGFNIFYPDVLILSIQDSLNLRLVRRQTCEILMQKIGFNYRDFTIDENSHMTISKTGDEEQLLESLNFFRRFSYPRSFTADKISLVTRPAFKKVKWENNYDFHL